MRLTAKRRPAMHYEDRRSGSENIARKYGEKRQSKLKAPGAGYSRKGRHPTDEHEEER